MEQSSAPLSEALSERLAAPAGVSGRELLLRRLADVLGARGLYHQAAKRLAHAGDKVPRLFDMGLIGLAPAFRERFFCVSPSARGQPTQQPKTRL